MSEFQICSTSRSHSQIDATHVREGGGGGGVPIFRIYRTHNQVAGFMILTKKKTHTADR